MATTAIVGSGATVLLDNAAGSPTSVGEVVSVTPIAVSGGTADATHLGSGGWRDFIATIRDAGEGSLTINWIPGDATDQLLRTAVGDGLMRTLKVTAPNTKFIQCECFVTAYEPGEITPDGKLEGSINVKFTGSPTYG